MHLGRDVLRAALARPGNANRGRGIVDDSTQPAAVVLPVHLGDEPRVIALLRAGTLRDHAGEVGFPGGKVDPTDADLQAAALRELEEEVDLSREDVEVHGTLGAVPVITGRYLIHPFVASIAEGRTPRIASSEIERLITLPLGDWIERGRTIHAVRTEWRGATLVTPFFELEGCTLYGASAYVFFELLERIAAELGVTLPPPVIFHEHPWGSRYG